jgi:hypothetical protein
LEEALGGTTACFAELSKEEEEKMRIYTGLLVAFALLIGAAASWGYPSLGGTTGLVSIPSAQVVPSGALDLAIDYQKVDDVRIQPMRACVGVGRGSEIWLSINEIGDGDTTIDRVWSAGIKRLVSIGGLEGSSVAVGVSGGKMNDGEDGTLTSAFLVSSKKMNFGPVEEHPIDADCHIGLMWTKLGAPYHKTMLRPFIGIEFVEDNGSAFAVEYRLKDGDVDDKAPLSAVLRFPAGITSKPLFVEVGITNAAIAGLGGDDNRFFFGLAYRTGGTVGPIDSETRTRPWGY